MSTFEAISIQGIRSFDPNKAQVLEFLKPVTIILGQNGSGKTTIIESLKYATTGDFPPGSKVGGSFVHDPKLAQESEIKAKISLEIKDLKGNSLSVSRSLKATQKDRNKQITLATLDSSIKRIMSNGESVSISSKCADINLEMTNSLGVSKAVLENVIFCHQEESNWPLMEGKQVKQRFDDLFASTRYVKALDSIRKTKIEKENEIKQYKTEIKYLKINRDEAQKKLSEKRILESKVAIFGAKIVEINEKLEPAELSIQNYQMQMTQVNQVESELKLKMNEKTSNENRIKELEKNISEPINHDIAELESLIADSGQQLERMKSEITSIEKQIAHLKSQNKKFRDTNNTLLVEKGGLVTQIEAQKVRQEKFNGRLTQLCTEMNVEHNEASATRTMKNFHDRISQDEEILNDKLSKEDQLIKEKQKTLDNKVAERTKLEHDIDTNKANLRKKNSELKNIESKIKLISEDADKLTIIDIDLSNLNDELNLFKENFNSKEAKDEIGVNFSDITELETELSTTDSELSNIKKLEAKFSEIVSLKQQIIDKSNEAKRLRGRHAENLGILFDNDIPKSNIKKLLGEKLSNWRMKNQKCQNSFNTCQSELASLNAEDKQLRNKLDEKREQVRKFEENLFKVCGNSEFTESLNKLKKKKLDMEEDISTAKGNVALYKKFLNVLTVNGSDCPLCHREFCNESESSSLIDEIKEKIDFGTNIDKKTNDLATLNGEYEELLKLQSQSTEINHLKATLIDNMEKESTEKRNAICVAKTKLEEITGELESIKRLESIGNTIQGDVALMEKLTEDVKEFEKNLGLLEAEIHMSPDQFLITVAELQSRKAELQKKISNKKKILEDLRKNYEKSMNKENELTSQMNNMEREKLKIQAGQQEYSSMCSKKVDIKQELQTIESSIQSNQESLEPMKKELSSIKSDLGILQQKRKSIENESRAKINNLTNQVRDLENILGDIKKFEKENVQERLNDLDKKITKNNEEFSCNNDSITEMETTIEVHKSTISNNKIKNRELADTLAIRQCHAKIVALDTDIQALVERLGGANLSKIQLELWSLENTRRVLKEELDSVNFQSNKAKNEINFIDQECRERYANAEPAYLEMLCKMKVIEIAVSDLEKYYKALDQAIMHHHKSKMTEINKILKELWRNTYSGKDIDYIEICSDEETTSAGSKRRNYNYRVVMVKSGIRLDMRSRCSAGQKVLASLLIRLSLAEVFCLHCGVLSLDEPTTNLDQENIENLACALVRIIKNRSKQKNFQLILITHDEEFLQLLARSDYVDEFYKIKCNAKGHSEIKKTRIDHR